MNTPEDRERELRLRQLETEIYQEAEKPEVHNVEPPLYPTRKHEPPKNSVQRFGRKLIKYAKFTGFVVAGIAIIKAGFFIGMWITYLVMTGIIAAIGYQIFLKDDR